MKSLINVINQNGSLVVNSRQVAESFEKQHKHIIEGIKTIETSVENSAHLFIESTYKDSYDRNQKEYLLTRDGFSLLVMGFTGQKALEWKLKYIEAFNNMEQKLKAPMQELSPQLQLLINMELKQHEFEIAITETKQEIQGMRDTMVLDHDSWRKECNSLINKIARQRGGTSEAYKGVREEVYSLVEQRAGANLKTRIVNKQDRMRREGTSESKVKAVSQVDVIAEDKRLKEIYIAVVKEMSIKYGI